MRALLRLLSVVLVLGVVAMGCSDDPETTSTGEIEDAAETDTPATDTGEADTDEPDPADTETAGADTAGAADDATTEEPATESGVVPDEYAEYCDASFLASQGDDLPFDAGPEEIEAYYRSLIDSLDDMLSKAPPELEADLETARASFGEVVAILEGVDWDLDVGLPEVEAWVNDPAVAEPMEEAITRLEAFDLDVCGIV